MMPTFAAAPARAALTLAAALLTAGASAGTAGNAASAPAPATPGAPACQARLAASLADMETRPLLKEEQATGVMWLRMDAEEALAAGEAEQCHALMDRVDLVLNIDTRGK